MWSISIYSGPSPFELNGNGPVLTKADVTDIPAAFVADPFMLRRNNTWFMFFEVMNTETRRGEIAFATSNDARAWSYQRSVIREPFHLSYPYVFEWQDATYMIPETIDAGAICLYQAIAFPFRWSQIARPIERGFADPSVFRFQDLWWMFACATPYRHDSLVLYYASHLAGPWTQHPKSPLLRADPRRARPAGRVLNFNNRLFRLAQNCVPDYGTSVRAFEISELTTTTYAEIEHEPSPILKASGAGWNASGMHHMDAHLLTDGKWLACVDGKQ